MVAVSRSPTLIAVCDDSHLSKMAVRIVGAASKMPSGMSETSDKAIRLEILAKAAGVEAFS